MTKKMIRVVVDDYVDIDYSTADDVINLCNEYKEKYGETVRFEFHDYTYQEGQHLVLTIERLENDEEYVRRVADEASWKESQDKRDREMFERLKKKFEDE